MRRPNGGIDVSLVGLLDLIDGPAMRREFESFIGNVAHASVYMVEIEGQRDGW